VSATCDANFHDPQKQLQLATPTPARRGKPGPSSADCSPSSLASERETSHVGTNESEHVSFVTPLTARILVAESIHYESVSPN